METTYPGSNEQVQGEWTDPDIAAAWRRWRSQHADLTRPLADLLLQAAQLRPGLHVLDLASGAGEPAFALAKAVEPHGRVTATDVSPAMLAIITESAKEEGLTNLRCRQADAAALPFPDQNAVAR